MRAAVSAARGGSALGTPAGMVALLGIPATQHGPQSFQLSGDCAQRAHLRGTELSRSVRRGRWGGRWCPHPDRGVPMGLLRAADPLHVLRAIFAQDLLYALDGIARGLQQVPYAAQELNVGRPIVAPAAAALHRLELGKFSFPEAEHVLSDAEFGRHLADVAKCFRCL